MSKVITFSQKFPSYHPKKGQNTFFVEKIIEWYWDNFLDIKYNGIEDMLYDLNKEKIQSGDLSDFLIDNFYMSLNPEIQEWKSQTVRAGHRFKSKECFSPRVWLSVPYKSKQIIILPDIQVKVSDFKLHPVAEANNNVYGFIDDVLVETPKAELLAHNDGLTITEFEDWFTLSPDFKKKQKFDGQIISFTTHVNS